MTFHLFFVMCFFGSVFGVFFQKDGVWWLWIGSSTCCFEEIQVFAPPCCFLQSRPCVALTLFLLVFFNSRKELAEHWEELAKALRLRPLEVRRRAAQTANRGGGVWGRLRLGAWGRWMGRLGGLKKWRKKTTAGVTECVQQCVLLVAPLGESLDSIFNNALVV